VINMKRNKGLKIFLISLAILFFIVVTVIAIFIAKFTLFDREKSLENMMEDYLANKYGEELKIDIVHLEGSNTGNMGNVWHTVVIEDNRNIKFNVNVNGFFKKEVVDDEYEYGLVAYEAYQKLKPSIGEIEELGFSRQSGLFDSEKEVNYIEYEKTYSDEAAEEILLNMRVKYEDLKVNDILTDDFINGMHQIIEIIKTNNIAINHVRVNSASTDNLHLIVKDVSDVRDKKDLITNLKNNNEDIVTYLEIDQYGTELKKLENERFIFDNEYHDKWLECEVVDEGECFNYSVHVLYKDDGLRTSNVH